MNIKQSQILPIGQVIEVVKTSPNPGYWGQSILTLFVDSWTSSWWVELANKAVPSKKTAEESLIWIFVIENRIISDLCSKIELFEKKI